MSSGAELLGGEAAALTLADAEQLGGAEWSAPTRFVLVRRYNGPSLGVQHHLRLVLTNPPGFRFLLSESGGANWSTRPVEPPVKADDVTWRDRVRPLRSRSRFAVGKRFDHMQGRRGPGCRREPEATGGEQLPPLGLGSLAPSGRDEHHQVEELRAGSWFGGPTIDSSTSGRVAGLAARLIDCRIDIAGSSIQSCSARVASGPRRRRPARTRRSPQRRCRPCR